MILLGSKHFVLSWKFLVFYVGIYLILCSILGGPKLRKWYGAPDLLQKDGPTEEDEDEYLGNISITY